MRKLADEWVEKAEGDYHSLQREVRARKQPNHDAACFHAQQCAEKYLKARLVAAGIQFPRTHDLVLLLDLLGEIEPMWQSHREDLAWLTAFAVEFRYPGESADKATATEALRRCKAFRSSVRCSLGG
jgi:HEPN domain-containing protein